MNKYAVTVIAVLLLPAGCSILSTGSGSVPALTGSEPVYRDNLTYGGADSKADNFDAAIPSPGYEAFWYLNRLHLFPSFFYCPSYAYYSPYAGPYAAVYGYQWLYYDDHHELNRYEHRSVLGNALTSAFENMRERLRDCRESVQYLMRDRREERDERFENIRARLQDIYLHELASGCVTTGGMIFTAA
jgi:hypothetical protein